MPYRWGSLYHMQLPSSLFGGGFLTVKADAVKTLLVLLQRYKGQSKSDRRKCDYSDKHIPNPDAVAKVPQKELAKATGYTLRSVSSATKSLREIGYIQVNRNRSLSRKRGSDGCIYKLMNPADHTPLANTGGNVIKENGLLYFSLPLIVFQATRERWSMASMTSAQWKLYVSICWLAAVKRVGNEFQTTKLELRTASGMQLVAFNNALDALEEKGLVYAEAAARTGDGCFTLFLCDPREGQPFEDDDDHDSQISNYHVTDEKGRSTRLITNTGTSEAHAAQMEACLRQALPPGDPIEDRGKGEFGILCPFHDDHHPSCAANVRKRKFHCFTCKAKGTLRQLVATLTGETKGQSIQRFAAASGQKAEFRQPDASAIAVYEYRDAWDHLEKKVLRFSNNEHGRKVFSQRRYVGSGRWVYGFEGCKAMLYHREMLWFACTVVITEGERDADTVTKLHDDRLTIGVTSGGAGSWHPSLAKLFKAHQRIVIAPDDDEAGAGYATAIAKSLDEERIPYRSLSFAGTGCKDSTEFAETYGADALRKLIVEVWEEPKVEIPLYGLSGLGGDEISI